MAVDFPTSPSNGQTFTSGTITYTYNATAGLWNSAASGGGGSSVTVSDTAPTSPSDGDQWYNSLDLNLYVYYNDGTSSQWVQSAPQQAGVAGADSTVAGPAGPAGGDGRAGVYADMATLIAKTGMVAGDQALVTALNKVFMYTGTAWYLVATMTNASPTAITGVSGSYDLATDGTATTITAVSTDPEGFALTWSYAVTTGSLGSTATVSQADNVFTITPSSTPADVGSFSITFSVTDGATGAVNAVSAFTLSFIVTDTRYTALSVKATATGSNQTFDDASTSNHTITAGGNATASTFSPYRHGGYSTYFDGVDDQLTVPASTDFSFDGDFQVEFWFYQTTPAVLVNDYDALVGVNSTGSLDWGFYSRANGDLFLYDYDVGGAKTYSGAIDYNTWNFVSWSRSGSTFNVHLNGTRIDQYTSSATVPATNNLWIGSDDPVANTDFPGYISDVRIVKGSTIYNGSNYTPPTAPLTAITNTKFLLGRLPYFKDQSASNHTITPNGNVSLKPKSVYDNAAYSEASHGASVHFDGTTGNRLTIPHHADFDFSGDYVLEFWCNLEQSANNQLMFDKSSGSENFQIYTLSSNNKIGVYYVTSSNTIVSYSNIGPVLVGTGWHHFSLVRDNSAGTYVSYLDGVVINTTTSAYNSTSTAEINIGASTATNVNATKGHISDFKFLTTIPSDRNAAFTPPTSPSTPDSYTKFLLNPETSISDLSQKSAITCIADAATSTTQVKFAGTKSIYLDGTGDFLQSSESVNIAGDWTIEGWYYFTTLTGAHSFFTIGDSASQANSMEFLLHTSGELRFYNMGSGYSNQHTPPSDFLANNWIHIAVVRSGTGTNNIKAYINGTQSGTGKTSNNDLIGKVNIGTELYNGAGSWFTQGYIQDFRVSSIARYTANFTPPTAELQG